MFPYPSGRIHMGHVRNYTMGDVVARYKRARKGFNVLHPMGWDASACRPRTRASARSIPRLDLRQHRRDARAAQVDGAVARLVARVRDLRPAYYKHQQKMFLDFLEAGLAERKKRKVNWDPVDMTVLANEQVIDGRGWRSGALVEQRELTQWFFKITEYAEELLDALDTLDRWPDKVRLMQRNWIGRSEGLLVRFALDPDHAAPARPSSRSSPRGPTRCSARSSWRSRRSSAGAGAAAKNPKLAEFIAECKRIGTAQGSSRPPRSSASTPASARASVRSRTGSCRSMSPTSC
jgi:leucyl-tRNA synthetase